MRRMINRSGPPRFPIPNARIFITILNWSGPMLYSPEPAHIVYIMHRSLSTIWSQSREPEKIRIAFGKAFTARRWRNYYYNSSPLQFLGRDVCAHSFVAGFKTAAFPDLQKLSGLPRSRRKQPRIRIHHVPNAKHCSHPSRNFPRLCSGQIPKAR